MADETFDAVICGGGCKALFLAMYLTRYAGMSVGIFERRHEIGGGLATEEISAPGFRGNTHANIIIPWYFAPSGVISPSSGSTVVNGTSTCAATVHPSPVMGPASPSMARSSTRRRRGPRRRSRGSRRGMPRPGSDSGKHGRVTNCREQCSTTRSARWRTS